MGAGAGVRMYHYMELTLLPDQQVAGAEIMARVMDALHLGLVNVLVKSHLTLLVETTQTQYGSLASPDTHFSPDNARTTC
jgi:hypothetical protein